MLAKLKLAIRYYSTLGNIKRKIDYLQTSLLVFFFLKRRQKICLVSLNKKFNEEDSCIHPNKRNKAYPPEIKVPKCLAPTRTQVLASSLILS
jgi:hypothetical protein